MPAPYSRGGPRNRRGYGLNADGKVVEKLVDRVDGVTTGPKRRDEYLCKDRRRNNEVVPEIASHRTLCGFMVRIGCAFEPDQYRGVEDD